MKRIYLNLFLFLIAVITIGCQAEESIQFEDAKLEQAIREELSKTNEKLTVSDIKNVKELDLSGHGITSLGGIEHFEALEVLSIADNDIRDFSILKKLHSLEEVNVTGNPNANQSEQLAILEELRAQGIIVIGPQKTVVGRPDGPGGFLWKVENENTTVYLQGTIHVGKEELFPLNEKIEQAYLEADVVSPEIDIVGFDLIEMQSIMMSMGTYQDGTTIKDHISDALYKKLEQKLSEFGMPIHLIENYQPWLMAQTVESLLSLESDFIEGVDEYFLTRAHDDGKEIIPLEHPEDQFAIFANLSEEYQVEMLEASLDLTVEEYSEQIEALLDVYMEGNQEKLLEIAMEDNRTATEEDEAFMRALNDDRNDGMADKIIGFLEKGEDKTYFVMVGALHLVLEPNIISILEEKGYTVEPLL